MACLPGGAATRSLRNVAQKAKKAISGSLARIGDTQPSQIAIRSSGLSSRLMLVADGILLRSVPSDRCIVISFIGQATVASLVTLTTFES